MSSKFNVYFGPYLRVPFVLQPVTNSAYTCTKCQLKGHPRSASFCATCGGQLSLLTTNSNAMRSLSTFDLEPKFDGDEFWTMHEFESNCASLWLPNKSQKCKVIQTFGEDRITVADSLTLTPEMLTEAVDMFTARYTEVIEYLREKHAIDVTVHIGHVPYWA